MSKPTPIDEWTPDKVLLMGVNDFSTACNISDAIKAALAAERELSKHWYFEFYKLREQQKPLVDGINEALQQLKSMNDFVPSRLVVVTLCAALAAERERYNELELSVTRHNDEAWPHCYHIEIEHE